MAAGKGGIPPAILGALAPVRSPSPTASYPFPYVASGFEGPFSLFHFLNDCAFVLFCCDGMCIGKKVLGSIVCWAVRGKKHAAFDFLLREDYRSLRIYPDPTAVSKELYNTEYSTSPFLFTCVL